MTGFYADVIRGMSVTDFTTVERFNTRGEGGMGVEHIARSVDAYYEVNRRKDPFLTYRDYFTPTRYAIFFNLFPSFL